MRCSPLADMLRVLWQLQNVWHGADQVGAPSSKQETPCAQASALALLSNDAPACIHACAHWNYFVWSVASIVLHFIGNANRLSICSCAAPCSGNCGTDLSICTCHKASKAVLTSAAWHHLSQWQCRIPPWSEHRTSDAVPPSAL